MFIPQCPEAKLEAFLFNPFREPEMSLWSLLASLVPLASLMQPVAADLRITSNHHSFGGVNYPQLQFFTAAHRDNTIREIVDSGARVIRLFSMYLDSVDIAVH